MIPVARCLSLPHAFYKLVYLEVTAAAALHYNNHDGVIHACVLQRCISAIKRTFFCYRQMYILAFFRVYMCSLLLRCMLKFNALRVGVN